MEKLSFMIFGHLSGVANKIVVSRELDILAETSHTFHDSREKLINMDEIFYGLEMELKDFDIEINNITYDENNESYTSSLIYERNTIGSMIIDKEGFLEINLNRFQQSDLDYVSLELYLYTTLSMEKDEIIDIILASLSTCNPLVISDDSAILYIDEDDKKAILNFFNKVFDPWENYNKFDRPYFLTIHNEDDNYDEIAELIINRLNFNIEKIHNIESQFIELSDEHLSDEDLEFIESLFESIIYDALFYEKILKKEIVKNLIKF